MGASGWGLGGVGARVGAGSRRGLGFGFLPIYIRRMAIGLVEVGLLMGLFRYNYSSRLTVPKRSNGVISVPEELVPRTKPKFLVPVLSYFELILGSHNICPTLIRALHVPLLDAWIPCCAGKHR